MLRQVHIFPSHTSSFIFSLPCQCSCRNAENEALTCSKSKRWAHLNIKFIALGELQSVSACRLRGGLVFQTGFVNSSFRAHLFFCGPWKTLQLREEWRERRQWEISIIVCHYLGFEAYGSCYNNKQSSICLTLLISARWIGGGLEGCFDGLQWPKRSRRGGY